MGVKVTGLSKTYNRQKAVDSISFEAGPGKILGFLGPNGAGKSTTMKMLACYLTPSSGLAEIAGFDTQKHPLEVKKVLGYLPENTPLYSDMYVREFLHFVASTYELTHAKQKVDNVIDQVGLQDESQKKIHMLSKGYRQRVGLAQAIIHDPKVLILDEPTSGLDPNQLADIRKLIRDLGQERTVILSTHIMQEVEALCDQVIIINKGVIVANDTLNGLKANNESLSLEDIFRKLTA
ncbi:MAG TPA: ATP-binding cassette domain-containing protein [Pedobacter sp.]|jgi:ABC-2 type transport system ATP-binding protein